MSVKEGVKAPPFSLPAGDGRTVSLDELRNGRWVVLYFYPKDDTPGCSKEACDFRDLGQRFARAGATVVGVSLDGLASHQTFASKYRLPFLLLSDEDKEVSTAYGVYKEKSLYGRRFMGIERTTFIINPNGRIAKIFPKVKVDGHADLLLSTLESLQQKNGTAVRTSRGRK